MPKVEIDIDERGRGRVIVDGVDMSDKVQRIFVDADAHYVTEVTLTLSPVQIIANLKGAELMLHWPDVREDDGRAEADTNGD